MNTPPDYLADDASDLTQGAVPAASPTSSKGVQSGIARGDFISAADLEAPHQNNKETSRMETSAAASQAQVTMPAEIQQHLGNLLKASYNDVLTAPIPDRFLKLLQELEDKDLQTTASKSK